MIQAIREMRKHRRGVALWLIAVMIAPWQFALAQEQNPRFYTVEKKLDRGGSFYLYMDVKDALRGLVNGLRQATMQPGVPPQAMMGFSIADRVIDRAGLYGVHDIGMSSMPQSDGLSVNKMYLSAPGGRTGALALFGEAPHAFDVLRAAPADAALVWSMDFDVEGLLELVRQIATDVVGTAGAQQVDQQLAMMGQKLGGDLHVVIASLSGWFQAIGRLDEQRRMQVSVNESTTRDFPEFQVLVSVGVRDSSLFDLVRANLEQGGSAGEEKTAEGMRVVPINMPTLPQWQVSPAIATDSERFYLTSHVSLLELVDRTRSGGANVTTNEEFQKLRTGLPVEGNGITYVSMRLSQLMQDISGMAVATKGTDAVSSSLLRQLQGSPNGHFSVTRSEVDGVWTVSRSASGGKQLAASLAAFPAGVMAAVAAPNFLEAQSRAKVSRAKADMRSMATAIEAYMIDTNAYPAWSAEAESSAYGSPVAPGGPLAGQPSFRRRQSGDRVMTLTTPIAYISRLPQDPFCPVEESPYSYWSQGTKWLVWSAGPDGAYDITLENVAASFARDGRPSDALKQRTYDPTNGTKSTGDIWRIRQ